jgi:DNA-binding transcriptional LysR family regulator
MELRQLEYFVTVAEEANFTRAAARLYVTQPGVSAQVRQLERELGQELLDRSGRTVRLTKVGETVLPYVRTALAALAELRQVVDQYSGLTRGKVAVGVLNSSSIDISGLLISFHQQYPGVEISLTEANSDVLVEALRSGELDLALVGLGGTPPADIETRLVLHEPIVAIVHPEHALAKRRSSTMTLESLQEYVLISLPRGTGTRTCLEAASAAAGIELRIAFEVSNIKMLGQLAGRGLGVALLPERVAAKSFPTLHRVAIVRPPLHARIELAWRARGAGSPAAKILIDHALAALVEGRKR